MSNEPPWKLAVIGAVAVIAGLALVLVDWTLAQLTAFAAMLFVARGALHIVTTSFEGPLGALSALLGCGEFGVAAILIARPGGTASATALTLGVLGVLQGVVEISTAIARYRNERRSLAPAVVRSAAAVS